MAEYLETAVDGISYERANMFVLQSPIADAEKVFRAVFESVTVVDSAVVAKAPTRALEDTYADSDVITLYTPGTWVPTGSTITKGAILIALLSWAHQLRLAADAE